MAADYTQPPVTEKRTRFFDGQFLVDQDFIDEQRYHIDRHRRHQRLLHVSGVCEGLEVRATGANTVSVGPGTAIDADGRTLALAAAVTVALPAETFNDKSGVGVHLAFREQPTDQQKGQGSADDTRWLERPEVVRLLPGESWTGTHPLVSLADLALDNRGGVTVSPGRRRYAGVRLAGPNADPAELRSLASGAVSVSTRLAVGPNARADAPQALTVDGGIYLQDGVIQNGGAPVTSTGDIGLYGQVPGQWMRLVTSGGPIKFFSDGGGGTTARLSVEADGKVGVGVGPQAWLDVTGAGNRTGPPSLLLRSGNGYNGFDGVQVAFADNGGARYRHSIRSRHNDGGSGAGNSLDFFLWGPGNPGGPDGIGATHVLSLDGRHVGIGTTTPENADGFSRVLDVLGDGHAKLSVRTRSIDARVLAHDGGAFGAPAGMVVGTRSGHALGLATGGITRLTVGAGGQVGIGGAPQTQRLTVHAGSGHVLLRRGGTETTGGSQTFLELQQEDVSSTTVPETRPGILFHHASRFWKRLECAADGFHLREGPDRDDHAGLEVQDLRVDGSGVVSGQLAVTGRVGIGSATPQAWLDVTGTGDRPGPPSLLLRSGNGASGFDGVQVAFADKGSARYRHTIRSRHNGGGSGEGNALDFHVWTPDNRGGPDGIGATHVLSLDGGHVGVGTTTPHVDGFSRVLDVLGDGHAKLSVRTRGIDARVLAHESGYFGAAAGMVVGTRTNHPLSLATGGQVRLAVQADGAVGIGVGNGPRAWLDVTGVGDRAGAPSLLLRSGNGSNRFDAAQVAFGYNGGGQYRHTIRTRHNAGAATGNALDFHVWTPGTAGGADGVGRTHVLSLDGGRVGVGVTEPQAWLDVNGVGDAVGPPSLLLRAGNGSDGFNGVQVAFADKGSARYRHTIRSRHNGGGWGEGNALDFHLWTPDNSGGPDGVGATYVMSLDGGTGGRVAIGGAHGDRGQRLTVNGSSQHLLLNRGKGETTGGPTTLLELRQDDVSPPAVPDTTRLGILFHHGNRWWRRIEAAGDGFHLREGPDDVGGHSNLKVHGLRVYGGGEVSGDWFVNGRLCYWWGPDNRWKHVQNKADNHAGSYNTDGPSDARLKTAVRPITGALRSVLGLTGLRYRWGDRGLDHLTRDVADSVSAGPGATEEQHRQVRDSEVARARAALDGDDIGLMAQEVEQVVPEVVREGPDGYKHIRYGQLTALLVEAIKEQQQTIDRLAGRLDALVGAGKEN